MAGQAAVLSLVELAHRQGTPLFELRAALDLFEFGGEAARAALACVVDRFPIESGSPELARAKATLING